MIYLVVLAAALAYAQHRASYTPALDQRDATVRDDQKMAVA